MKAFSNNPHDPSLISGVYAVEGENKLPQVVLCPLHREWGWNKEKDRMRRKRRKRKKEEEKKRERPEKDP